MKLQSFSHPERLFFYAGMITGFTVSLMLAPKNENFFPNFWFYWLSQLAVVSSVSIYRPRPAIVGALAVVLAGVLVGFRTWVISRSHSTDGGVWFLYLILLAGEAIGGLVGAWICSFEDRGHAVQAALITAVFVLTGSVGSTTLACSTDLLYCRW